MKKLIVMLVAIAICLPLFACGSGDNKGNENVPVDIEDGMTDADQTQNTEPEYDTIELTLENWDEYFEITDELYFCRNEFDEIWRIDCNFNFKLKPEYSERCLGVDDFAAKIAWTETTVAYGTINYENVTYELTEDLATNNGAKTNYSQVVTNIGNFTTSFYQEQGYFMHFPYDFEVHQIKGQLYIAKDNVSGNANSAGNVSSDIKDGTTDNNQSSNADPRYDAVELTLENWDEYFEITNELYFCRNEFDEIWRIDCNFNFELKPEYSEKCVGSDDFAAKIAWTETTVAYGTINYENVTYELTEDLATNNGAKTNYSQVVTNTGNFTTSFYQEQGYFMHFPYDFEVSKIKGVLYFEKN